MKKFISEFKEFALRGNMLDLAVGVIIGSAFQSIINSLVNDVIMPLIGALIGNIDFSNLFIVLGPQAKPNTLSEATELGLATFNYGNFITAIINFILMAVVIFLLIKFINKISKIGKKVQDEIPTTKDCSFCMTKIDIKATRCPHCTSMLIEE